MTDDRGPFTTKREALIDAVAHARMDDGAMVFLCVGPPNCTHDHYGGPNIGCQLCEKIDPMDPTAIDRAVKGRLLS